MKCYNHTKKDAVAQCIDCGRGLCEECADRHGIVVCDLCASVRNASDKDSFKKTIIMGVVGLIVGLILGVMMRMTFGAILFNGLAAAGIAFGWQVLNRITPKIFIWMPLIGWLIYFVLKFGLALAIGIFAMPYYIYKSIKGLKEAKIVDEYIESNRPKK